MDDYVIKFFTKEPKPPEIFRSSEIKMLLERVVELTKNRAKFIVLKATCICDFS